MKPLKINPEYQTLVPRPIDEEYKSLELDIIEKKGATEPIKINKKDEILDGHTRFEICSKHALHFDTQIMDFQSVLDEKIYIIETNLKRRHLTDYQKIEMAKPLEGLIAEKAGQRQLAGTLSSNEDKGRTGELTAKAIGVSKATYERGKKVRDEGTEEERKKALSKKYAVNSAYRDLMKRQRQEALTVQGVPPLPEGEYDVIYVDPPWDYDFKLRGAPDEHYPVMSDQKICDLQIPSAENAILFLWATNPRIESALKVLKAWGFTYKTNMVWVKDKIGTGYYFRGQHELLFVASKGDISPPFESVRKSSVLYANRKEHSKKPEEVYTIIEDYYPNGKYLELFSRNKREGWMMWGFELE